MMSEQSKQAHNTLLFNKQAIPGVAKAIVVASGKGGVGKSTVAVNLALALKATGVSVGLLDADIYGPSLVKAFSGAPESGLPGPSRAPHQAFGMQYKSIAHLVDTHSAVIWRGPMATKALMQLMLGTQWSDLEYLIVDMPPGTGDIALTLAQKTQLTGAVIVTTPQDLALIDAQKAIDMFIKVSVPIIGLVENMAIYECSRCGHQESIFGEAGGLQLAESLNVPLLGQIPLHKALRKDMDAGIPTLVSEHALSDHHSIVGVFKAMATQLLSV